MYYDLINECVKHTPVRCHCAVRKGLWVHQLIFWLTYSREGLAMMGNDNENQKKAKEEKEKSKKF